MQAASFPIPANVHAETVLSVKHYTDKLFSFRISRPQSFRFRSGEFVMIGLPNAEKPVFRAYSIASPAWSDELEFLSIKVPDGPLTSKLQLIQPGDKVLLGRKSTGTLVHDALTPGKRLYLFSTGTGIAPFASVIRDPETYERFEKVVIVHGCRTQAELAYRQLFEHELHEHEYLGEYVRNQLLYYPTVTRERFRNEGRITELMASGKLHSDLGLDAPTVENDRYMICGSPAMLRDLKRMCEERGLQEGNTSTPGAFVIERAFADS